MLSYDTLSVEKNGFHKKQTHGDNFQRFSKETTNFGRRECKSSPRSSVPALREQDEDEEDVVSCAVG